MGCSNRRRWRFRYREREVLTVRAQQEADPFATSLAGRRLGRYEVLARLASGGMAAVYVARALGVAGFERLFAIKVLHPHLAHEDEFITMFLDEARLAARIRHPNVVPTTDVSDTRDAGFYLVMDYIEGDHLGTLLQHAFKRGTRIPAPATLRIVADALEGLSAAHQLTNEHGEPLNLVHRDVSPHNIMVSTDGVSRITDFGVAKASIRLSTTQEGQFKGKLAYMAPEHAANGQSDQRSDLFAMSIILWECLTGRRLFRAENHAATLNKICLEPIPAPSLVDPALAPFDPILERGLARDPNRRFQSAEEFAEAIERTAFTLGGMATHRAVAKLVKDLAAEKIARDHALIKSAIAELARAHPEARTEQSGPQSGVRPHDPRTRIDSDAHPHAPVADRAGQEAVPQLTPAELHAGKSEANEETRPDAGATSQAAASTPDSTQEQPDEQLALQSRPPAQPGPQLDGQDSDGPNASPGDHPVQQSGATEAPPSAATASPPMHGLAVPPPAHVEAPAAGLGMITGGVPATTPPPTGPAMIPGTGPTTNTPQARRDTATGGAHATNPPAAASAMVAATGPATNVQPAGPSVVTGAVPGAEAAHHRVESPETAQRTLEEAQELREIELARRRESRKALWISGVAAALVGAVLTVVLWEGGPGGSAVLPLHDASEATDPGASDPPVPEVAADSTAPSPSSSRTDVPADQEPTGATNVEAQSPDPEEKIHAGRSDEDRDDATGASPVPTASGRASKNDDTGTSRPKDDSERRSRDEARPDETRRAKQALRERTRMGESRTESAPSRSVRTPPAPAETVPAPQRKKPAVLSTDDDLLLNPYR